MVHKEEINKSTKTDSKLMQVLENKDIKTIIIIVFYIFKKLSRDLEDITKKETKLNL